MSFKINIANYEIINKTLTSVYATNKIPVVSIVDLDNNSVTVNDNNNNQILYRILKTISYVPQYEQDGHSVNGSLTFIFTDDSSLTVYENTVNYQCNINSKGVPIKKF
jgi:hypothetical protein